MSAVVYQAVVMWTGPKNTASAAVPWADSKWLRRFHDGDSAIIGEIYDQHFDTICRAVGMLPIP
jgi:hypothetical protein